MLPPPVSVLLTRLNPGPRLLKYALVGALIVVPVGIQTARIEGLRFGHIQVLGLDFWLVKVKGFKEDNADCLAEKRAMEETSHRNERVSEVIAKDIDDEHKERVTRHQALARRHIDDRRNRVLQNPVTQVGANPDTDPGIPEPTATGDTELVAVKPRDVEICTEWVDFGLTADKFLRRLKEEGLATDLDLPEPAFGEDVEEILPE